MRCCVFFHRQLKSITAQNTTECSYHTQFAYQNKYVNKLNSFHTSKRQYRRWTEKVITRSSLTRKEKSKLFFKKNWKVIFACQRRKLRRVISSIAFDDAIYLFIGKQRRISKRILKIDEPWLRATAQQSVNCRNVQIFIYRIKVKWKRVVYFETTATNARPTEQIRMIDSDTIAWRKSLHFNFLTSVSW